MNHSLTPWPQAGTPVPAPSGSLALPLAPAGAVRHAAPLPPAESFSPAQRRWLEGLAADLLALPALPPAAQADVALLLAAHGLTGDAAPWHKPNLPLAERMVLAEGRPLPRRLMAAMAQQDCRQCGYVCETYADALAAGGEPRMDLCAPGGKDTARMIRALLDEDAGGARAFDADAHLAKARAAAAPPPRDTRPGYDRGNPVLVAMKSRRRLSRAGSDKSTVHVELDLSGSGIEHLPGDTLGIYPENDPVLVDAVLAALQAPPGLRLGSRPLRDILTTSVSLGTAPDALFTLIACLTGGERRQNARRLASGADPEGASLDVLGALERFPGVRPDPEAFVESLDPLQPRLYSIASSARIQPGVAALTVAHVRYTLDGRLRQGVASSWLAERAPVGTRLRAFLQPAPHFRLPDTRDAPIIMVGPGTGIAPFRAFLQERRARSETGPSWLFFGHRRAAEDYFYEDELRAFRAQGTLTRLSLAWSRDGARKTYVQDLMRENGEELWEWLFDGAHLYVCGDAQRMAADVEQAIIDIIVEQGDREPDAARAYLDGMKAAGRCHLDVY
ncbi:sulfite reductase subunit alpha [Azorhizobium doebereinerae]|uniref:sulfite reductase subunit alpha n=1 Tax=Azorhizobium doebereinerae TaxID=281091 RepID=UPI0003FCA85E|nr:sulfite reductase subunit alpha [Azorhizobium doebereinerae]